jgi:hypothetical protein
MKLERRWTDEDVADALERAMKLLRCGDEARGTMSWYLMTEQALRDVHEALEQIGIATKA